MEYSSLLATIDANIRANGNEEITGPVLNGVLRSMVSALGNGFQFKGIAQPGDNPGTPDAKVFYLATTPGTYANFGGATVTTGQIVALLFDTSWHAIVLITAAALHGSSSEDFAAKVMHAFQVISDTSVTGKEVVGETVAGDKLTLHNSENEALTDIVPGGQSEDIEVVMPPKSGTLALQEDVDEAVSQLGQELNGESFEESVSFNLTSGQKIETVSQVHSMQLIAGKVYKVTYSNNRANGTSFNIYLRTQEDGAVQFKNSDNPDDIASKSAQNSANVSSTILERYISPVSNSDRVMIYAASTDVKDTIVLGITFTLLSDGGLVKDVSDLEEAVEAITPIVPVVTENKNKISALPERDIFDFDDFVVGNNWHGIFVPGEAYRISMKETHIANKDLYLKADDGFRLIVNLFTNGSYVGDSGATTQYVIKKGVEYLLVIRRATENTSEVADLFTFVPKVKFPTDFYTEFKGAGFVEYYGAKVPSLSLFKTTSRCADETLVSENQGSSDNYMTSGLVVYGGKAFCFTDNMSGTSYCCVFDLATKEQIDKATLPWAAHNNNAQPTPYFYNSGDEYPLFLVSRGDYSGQGEQKFYFVRVTESGGTFTFTIVKEVSYSGFAGEQYNASWFANYEKNELFCYTYPNGGWSVTVDNPIVIYKFDLPSLADYSPVAITGNDIKETITLQDHWIMQSGLYHNGKIFLETEADSSWSVITINGEPYDGGKGKHLLFVIDSVSGYIETIIPLHSDQEQEGLCISNGALYVSEKYTTAAQGNVCFRLVKYSF